MELRRPSLAAFAALCALSALLLLLLFREEVLQAHYYIGASRSPNGLAGSAAQPYAYAFHGGTVRFPMLSLGARALPACPGGPYAPPYVTVVPGGRLGNLILEYASAWAVARAHGLPAFVDDDMLRRLKKVFAGLSLRGALDVLGGDAACRALLALGRKPWESLQPVDLAQTPLPQVVRTAREQRQLIVLDKAALLPEAVVPLATELREELRFLGRLRDAAQAELRRLRKRAFPQQEDQGEVIFAAVHARRTDYGAQLRLLYNVTREAGAPFFVTAAAWLRRALPVEARLLLVVASDDPRWAQEELVPALAAAGAAERVGGGWEAAWAGNGDQTRPDRDLALLAACNHTIFSYGTFGLAAALAAGGRAVVYQLAEQPAHPTLLTPSEQFARHMPGWVALR